MPKYHKERHLTGRIGWLRAAVLGANDGIVSTASLVLGVASAHSRHSGILVAGIAGMVAGAMSMAAGEYVSVHSQADTEAAELDREREELKADDEGEHRELAAIYVARGLEPSLAKQVSEQLMKHDALGAHAQDELGISETLVARPIQAALASAASFGVGAAMPLLVVGGCARGKPCPSCCWNIARVSGDTRRVGGTCRRRGCADGGNAGHILGRTGDGCYRGCWCSIRNRCLSRLVVGPFTCFLLLQGGVNA